MKTAWRFLNSPLLVLIVAFILWPFVSALEKKIVVRSTFDAVFNELNRSTDKMTAQAKNSGIKTLVSSIVSQFIEGFTSAFDSIGAGQSAKLSNFTSTLKHVSLKEVKTAPSNFSSKERIIGEIHNESSDAITDIHLNFTMYAADGSLLDVADQSLHEIKVLLPGQSIGFTVDHDLGDSSSDKAVLEARKAVKITAQIVSFDIQQPPKK